MTYRHLAEKIDREKMNQMLIEALAMKADEYIVVFGDCGGRVSGRAA